MVAGDIACAPSSSRYNSGNGTSTACRQKWVSELLVAQQPDAVLTLGDNQYETGQLANFNLVYDPTWGRVKDRTFPATGNHEYGTTNAQGYRDYFGARADPDRDGNLYYSYNLGAWHVIALDSMCNEGGGCAPGTPQYEWLKADLAANAARCTLAYWHHPRFSSSSRGNNNTYQAFWQALYDAGADVVLAGHEHHYERFAPQDPSGKADPARGIREFVVGTGGKSHYGFGTIRPNSEVRSSGTFGVLKLTLHATSYEWQFVPEAGKSFTDSGSTACH